MSALFFDKNVTFATLPLDKRVFKSLARQHLIHPSIIQSKVLPLALTGRDLSINARTGAGKTLAYAIPVVQSLLVRIEQSAEQSNNQSTRGIRAIVLLPTRDLCVQVKQVFDQLIHYSRDCLTTCLITAEVNQSVQIPELRALPSIIIATPARLVSLLQSNVVTIDQSIFQCLVLDEADLLLSYDYQSDILELLKFLPKSQEDAVEQTNKHAIKKSSKQSTKEDQPTTPSVKPAKLYQTLLLSATLNHQVTQLSKKLLRDPSKVEFDESAMPATLTQLYISTAANDKLLLAYALIKLRLITGKSLFFVNDVDTAFRLKLFLEQFGIKSAVLNEALPYNSRLSILTQFNRGAFDFLIATDRATVREESEIKAVKLAAQSVDDLVKVEDSVKDGDDEMVKEESDDVVKAEDDEEAEEIEDEQEEEVDEEEKIDDEDDEDEEQDAQTKDESDDESEPVVKEEDAEDLVDESLTSRPSRKRKRGREFGVSRGIDFHDVVTVVNYDFPVSVKSYIHRVGRTARAGKLGTAISFAPPDDEHTLEAILEHQRAEQANTVLDPTAMLQQLHFKSEDVEGFRYRVEDVSRAVTGVAVREARLKDLKQELLNATKLQAHFEDNPRELDLLRHDRVLRPTKVQKHLQHVPDYLMPAGFTQEEFNTINGIKTVKGQMKKKRKYTKRGGNKENPLKSFKFKGKGGKDGKGKGDKGKGNKQRNSKKAEI